MSFLRSKWRRAERKRVLSRSLFACGWIAFFFAPSSQTGRSIPLTIPPARYEYWRAPTTQIGMPNGPLGSEVTPEGDLYTGYDEFFLRYGYQGVPGQIRSKTWLAGDIPIVRQYQQVNGLIYRIETFGTSLNGRLDGPLIDMLSVTIENRVPWPRTAYLSSGFRYRGAGVYRPKPRIKFNPRWVYRFQGNLAIRGGLILGSSPSGYSLREGYPGQSYDERIIPYDPKENYKFVFRGSDRGIKPSSTVLDAIYQARLEPYEERRLIFKIPHPPLGLENRAALARLDYDEERRKIVRLWESAFDRGATLLTPDAKLTELAKASVANLFIGCDIQGKWLVPRVNELQYDGFYYRDGAWMIRAFDLLGYPAQSRRLLDYFIYRQKPSGLFLSQPGQYDGWGQALWALGEHARIVGDPAYARRILPSVKKAVGWLKAARLADAKATGSDGLLPAADPKDNEQVGGHLFGPIFWANRGLIEAADIAEEAGDPDLAKEWRRDLSDFREALMASLKRATARTGGYIPPAEEPGGYDWGNLQAVFPGEALSPDHPWATATLKRARSEFNEGLMTYGDHDTIHAYVGFDIPETELLRGEKEKALDYLLSSAAHTTGANGGFEYGSAKRRDYGKNLSPHGCWAAKYLSLYRNCLIREDGDTLRLGSALSPAWVQPGLAIRVENAPTDFGPASYVLAGREGGAMLTIRAPSGPRAKKLQRIALDAPVGATFRSIRASKGATLQSGERILLPPKTQTVEIRWTLPADAMRWTAEAYMKRYCLPPVVAETTNPYPP